jgi:hypothetical protein
MTTLVTNDHPLVKHWREEASRWFKEHRDATTHEWVNLDHGIRAIRSTSSPLGVCLRIWKGDEAWYIDPDWDIENP